MINGIINLGTTVWLLHHLDLTNVKWDTKVDNDNLSIVHVAVSYKRLHAVWLKLLKFNCSCQIWLSEGMQA